MILTIYEFFHRVFAVLAKLIELAPVEPLKHLRSAFGFFGKVHASLKMEPKSFIFWQRSHGAAVATKVLNRLAGPAFSLLLFGVEQAGLSPGHVVAEDTNGRLC